MKKTIILTSPLNVMVPIIKVTGNYCNLRCAYCFYNTTDQSTRSIMSYELLEKFLVEYLELFTKNIKFIWHGGEPLLAGLSFFQKVVEIQSRVSKADQIIQNYIQTNATLITDNWAELFKKHNFKVGISLDGDKESHDRFRKNHNDRGSFEQVRRGIEILRKYGIHPGVIQTLTVDNLSHTKKNFYFFANAGIKNLSTNIYHDVYSNNQTMSDQNLTNRQLTAFLIEQIDLWLDRNDSKLKIREIENYIAAVFGKKPTNCCFNGFCTSYFCVENDGRIYPCDRSSNFSDLLLGDISKQSLREVLSSPARLRYAERVNSLPAECLSCEWQKSCYNGCTMQRVGGIGGKYYFCETRKSVFVYLRDRLSESFSLIKQARR